jgi:hypothetical protein
VEFVPGELHSPPPIKRFIDHSFPSVFLAPNANDKVVGMAKNNWFSFGVDEDEEIADPYGLIANPPVPGHIENQMRLSQLNNREPTGRGEIILREKYLKQIENAKQWAAYYNAQTSALERQIIAEQREKELSQTDYTVEQLESMGYELEVDWGDSQPGRNSGDSHNVQAGHQQGVVVQQQTAEPVGVVINPYDDPWSTEPVVVDDVDWGQSA